MSAFFRALSVFRDMRAVAHGPRATVSRVARKHIYRAVGRSVRQGLEHFYGAILSITAALLPPLALLFLIASRGGLIHELRILEILGSSSKRRSKKFGAFLVL